MTIEKKTPEFVRHVIMTEAKKGNGCITLLELIAIGFASKLQYCANLGVLIKAKLLVKTPGIRCGSYMIPDFSAQPEAVAEPVVTPEPKEKLIWNRPAPGSKPKAPTCQDIPDTVTVLFEDCPELLAEPEPVVAKPVTPEPVAAPEPEDDGFNLDTVLDTSQFDHIQDKFAREIAIGFARKEHQQKRAAFMARERAKLPESAKKKAPDYMADILAMKARLAANLAKKK